MRDSLIQHIWSQGLRLGVVYSTFVHLALWKRIVSGDTEEADRLTLAGPEGHPGELHFSNAVDNAWRPRAAAVCSMLASFWAWRTPFHDAVDQFPIWLAAVMLGTCTERTAVCEDAGYGIGAACCTVGAHHTGADAALLHGWCRITGLHHWS